MDPKDLTVKDRGLAASARLKTMSIFECENKVFLYSEEINA